MKITIITNYNNKKYSTAFWNKKDSFLYIVEGTAEECIAALQTKINTLGYFPPNYFLNLTIKGNYWKVLEALPGYLKSKIKKGYCISYVN